jgi:putative ABC transport system permease protein
MLNQILALTLLNLRSIPQRIGSSLVIVIGMVSVVAVVVSVLSMSSGYVDSVNKTGRRDRAIVTSGGAVSESVSSLSRDAVLTIKDAPAIKKFADGRPIASADIFAYQSINTKADHRVATATLHGVGPEVWLLLPQIKLVTGRMFKPGRNEMVVGAMMQSQFEGLEIGSVVELPEGDWTIVGTFKSEADQHESELLGDAQTLMSALRRTTFNSVTVLLESPDDFITFKDWLTIDPALSVDVVRESTYFSKLSKPLNDFLLLVASAVGGIMGLGAAFGAINTMYTAVSIRIREIATLRAIGFSAAGVVASVLAEALVLALIGSVLGAAIARGIMDGRIVVSGYCIYSLVVTLPIMAIGIGWGIAIGMIGGILPAIRAATLNIPSALRAI